MQELRENGRETNELRPVKIHNNYLMHPAGSVLIEMGNTKVICTAIVEEKTAKHLKGTGQGWISAEYSMLPGSTKTRKQRDSSRGRIDGRSQEIQRLIGRSLRSVTDLQRLGERTIWLDCDVIQADGGTRTAAITGAFVAMLEAMNHLKEQGLLEEIPVKTLVSAVSVGVIGGEMMLDLCYKEDANAQVDMNVVMTGNGEFIEVQGTGEESPFTKEQLQALIALAEKGCADLHRIQQTVLESIALGREEKNE